MENWTPKPCKHCGAAFDRVRRVQQYCSRICYLSSKAPPRGTNECWNWTGPINSHGYGIATENFKSISAHRMAYEAHKGPLGDMFALHHCDNRRCVNPAHLYAGTQADNVRDRVSRGRSRYVIPNLRGERHPMAKASPAEVLEMRELRREGQYIAHIAKRYPHLSEDGVRRIINRKTWRHV